MTTHSSATSVKPKFTLELWILFWGSLISMAGQSLVWPFLTIYIRQQLDVPLTQITFLFTLQTIATLTATAFAGPLVDRWGRKWVMVLGPILGALTLILMTQATTYTAWACLLMTYASAGILFRLGSQAMVADMIEPDHRTEAYALLRTAANVGIAVGPAIGGQVIQISYTISFFTAAIVQFGLAIVALFLLKETLTDDIRQQSTGGAKNDQGYGPMFRDRLFMSFWGVYLLIELATSLVFTLLGVYVFEQYNITENLFGLIIGVNAGMVVFFQYGITRLTKRYRPFKVMAISGLFYAGGMAVFAIGRSFPAFLIGMVIMTTGELLLSPTATAFVANLAPVDMRGRYMGVYGLSFRVGGGIGPVIGGILSDNLFPAAIWLFGMSTSVAAAVGFGVMSNSSSTSDSETTPAQSS